MFINNGAVFKNTLRTKIFLKLYGTFHKISQWFIHNADKYPCAECMHHDDYGCVEGEWTGAGCIYEAKK